MSFDPIAIVGRAAVLPGAPTAEALWDVVSTGRDCIRSVEPSRWRVNPASVLGHGPDRTWSDRGGYVTGFEQRFAAEVVADPFVFPADKLLALDPLFQMVLHTGRAALRDAGHSGSSARVGAIFGNLSYPSAGLSAYAESVWFGRPRPDAMNRFMSGMPAHLLAANLGLGGPAFALDAACASSLYALDLACKALHDGSADVMLAGAVNRCDDLFIHTGFCALKAMSASGRSRPFHAEADGLVPGEGAAFLVLKRLSDVTPAERVYGVVRGIGLSNDGRGKNFLAPAEEGQVRAMQAAWSSAGLDPRSAGLIECHATGTTVGDATELRSMRQVFGDTPIPIGSLKSNLGHLITTAGVAGILKVLGAMEHGVRPHTLHVDDSARNPELGAFRVLAEPEPWEGPHRAAVSAFGFGGNNAHVILEGPGAITARPTARRSEPVAIVALGARVGSGTDAVAFRDHLNDPAAAVSPRAADIELSLRGLRFPPIDLQQSRAQQNLVLAAAREAIDTAPVLPRDRTMVLVGMGTDPEVCRYGARWRLADQVPPERLASARDGVIDVLQAAGVVGNMPNIPANRLNSQFDLAGPSYTVSAEELSGSVALDIARRSLAAHEVDAAVVGAVDLSVEPVHIEALRAVGVDRPAGDAAVVFVLERLSTAVDAGHPVLAVLDDSEQGVRFGVDGVDLTARFGHSHAASGLVHVAAAALSGTQAHVVSRSLTGRVRSVGVSPGTHALGPRPAIASPTLVFPAHPSPVPLLAPESHDMQTMDPAPQLPSTSFDGPTTPPATPLPPTSAPTVVHPPVPPGALRQVPLQGHPAAVLIAAQQALGETHRAYMQQQQALHEQFLATRRSALAALAGARGRTQGTAPVAPPRSLAGQAAPPVRPLPVVPAVAMPSVAATPPPSRTPRAAPTASTAQTAPAKPGLKSRPDDGSFELPGPRFDRADLEHLASHRISDRFGPAFAIQDDFPRQVRMPEPPLLLCDRVTGIDAEPTSMTTGTIWTETDVEAGDWYLHQDHMPAGVMIESGQADLLLISWLGADFENRGARVYRLLGCELTYHRGLPAVGDTLKYDIHVDGHAKQGDQRLFFFHYDCRVDGEIRLSVREGQAGFFSDEELANSGGILWTPETGEHAPDARVDAPALPLERTSFDQAAIEAFAMGHPVDCFGESFAVTEAHTRTPRISHEPMLFLERVTHVDHTGGPWGRGYLRAEDDISPDDWFFDGHFKDDPCMPGTLMLEGCLQALAFYVTSLGYTLNRDGWRFEPVPGIPYALKCRGQCTPESRLLVYEVFVEEVHDGPIPTVYADFLCTVDGLGAFHARRVGLQLIPGWPLDESHALLDGYVEPKPVATMEDGFPFDYKSLLACAWGKPSEAFGAPYAVFDHVKKVARLPGPPYLFLSRVLEVSEPFGGFTPGVKIVVEYDLPEDAWYFWENAHPTMPFAVLLEAALQPCGWLASYVGSALSTDEELFFRNLDGTGTLHVELLPTSGTLRTEVEITGISNAGGMIIESFLVTCWIDDVRVYDLKTVFGFFPGVALANQLGIPPKPAELAAVKESNTLIDLRSRPAAYFEGPLRLPRPMLLMCDRIVGWWPDGGAHGLGRVIGEKDVDPREWFFASHFFQDPVQPGSLGIENLLQVIMWTAIEKGLHEGMADPHFEPILLGAPHVWKYRGQVVPKNDVIRAEVEIQSIDEDDRGRTIVAHAYLWADDLRIYEAIDLGVRVVDGPSAASIGRPPATTDRDVGRSYLPAPTRRTTTELLDPAIDTWLGDHCPTWTVPALPAMSMVDRLMGLTDSRRLENVTILRWLALPAAVEVRGQIEEGEAQLLAWRKADRAELSRFEPVCTAVAAPSTAAPAPWDAVDGFLVDDPYAAGELFHGPSFQLMVELRRNEDGASAILDASHPGVPRGTTHQALLDAMTHAIPHDALGVWFPEIGDDQVAYPHKLAWIEVYGAAPTGRVRAEVRPLPIEDARHPRVGFQIVDGDRVWAAGELTEVCLPKGPLGAAEPRQRRAFLRDRQWVYQLGLSSFNGESASARASTLHASDWLPGTVASAYDLRLDDRLAEVAIKDLVAQHACVHPSEVDASVPSVRTTPLTRWPVELDTMTGRVTATSTGNPDLDISAVKRWWSDWFDVGRWPVEDLYYGLIEEFVGQVHVEDPDALEAIHGRSTLFLANHQVAVESLLFSILASGLTGVPTVTLAKIEHQHTWLGRLIEHSFRYPGVEDPEVITFFDRDDKESLPRIIGELAAQMMGPGRSVMVHIEGTRSLECRTPVQKMSSAFIDMALKTNSPIVPVRFAHALPVEPLEERLEFPVGLGRQDIHFGRPLLPEELTALPFKERKAVVIDAINGLGPSFDEEAPSPPSPGLQEAVAEVRAEHPNTDHEHAVISAVLRRLQSRCRETDDVLAGVATEPWSVELQRRLRFGL